MQEEKLNFIVSFIFITLAWCIFDIQTSQAQTQVQMFLFVISKLIFKAVGIRQDPNSVPWHKKSHLQLSA